MIACVPKKRCPLCRRYQVLQSTRYDGVKFITCANWRASMNEKRCTFNWSSEMGCLSGGAFRGEEQPQNLQEAIDLLENWA